MHRKARFAGPNTFYSNQPTLLENFFRENTKANQSKLKAKTVICPHAGYIFSGKTALLTLDRIQIPDNVVLLGPNHTGIGSSLSMMINGDWEIPGGKVSINTELADLLLQHSTYLEDDESAHIYEHSIEVILPMIHFFNPQVSIVPIIMSNYSSMYINDLINTLYKTSIRENDSFLLIVSSDMSHFISRKEAKNKDELAFEKIRKLDSSGLMKTVVDNKISMCGSGPVAVGLAYSKMKGASKVELVDYTDSGYITGNTEEIVSYAGFVIH